MFDFRTDYREDGFFQITIVKDFQTVLNACLTVGDWETFTSANFWVYLGVKTCKLFLCFVAIVRVKVFYVDFFVFFVLRHW